METEKEEEESEKKNHKLTSNHTLKYTKYLCKTINSYYFCVFFLPPYLVSVCHIVVFLSNFIYFAFLEQKEFYTTYKLKNMKKRQVSSEKKSQKNNKTSKYITTCIV